MMLAYAFGGGFVGAAIGLYNWSQPMSSDPWWHWMLFTFAANGVWSAIFGLIITLPLFFVLSCLIPAPREAHNLKVRQREVWWVMIVPAAFLQGVGSLLAGALFLVPLIGAALQRLAPGTNVDDVLMNADYAFLLLGSGAGALFLGLSWHFSQPDQEHGSRLLPLD